MSAVPAAGLVDYRMGNLASVSKALERAGAAPQISDQAEVLQGCDLLVLPGVGNFAAGIRNLEGLGLVEPLKKWAADGKPLVGICMGMQMFFEDSQEGPSHGLGILPGSVVKIDSGAKVPHMGWNSIEESGDTSIFKDFSGRNFYFVHSYVCVPARSLPGATTQYGGAFTSAVEAENVCGVQFHPEKSSTDGLALLRRIVSQLLP